MIPSELISKTILFVKKKLENAEGGHDWFHIERVYKNAISIAEYENCNIFVVQLGALLHDIADSKFHNGDESIGPKIARTFLESENVDAETIRIIICNYVAACLLKQTNVDKVRHLLMVLECFSEPYLQSDKMAPLLLSLGLALGMNS